MKKINTFLALVSSFVLLITASPVVVWAQDSQDLSEAELRAQGVYFVGRTSVKGVCDGTGSTTTLSGNDNIEKIYNFLVGKGLTAMQAAGLMGNMKAESGFEPRQVEISYSDPPHLSDSVPPTKPGDTKGRPGYGLVQWTGTRKQPLADLAASRGLPASDLTLQLDYLWQELNGPYNKNVLTPLQQSTTLEQATNIILEKFEVPADIAGTRPGRIANATEIYNKYGGGTAGTTASSSQNCGSATSTFTKLDDVTYYSQCDPQWRDFAYPYPGDPDNESDRSVCTSGCGPTTVAMVVSTLTGTKVLPTEVATYSLSKGYRIKEGSSWTLMTEGPKNWGLNSTAIGNDATKIKETLAAGGLVLASYSPGHFTSGGHFIVIRGVTPEGKYLVADPNDRQPGNPEYQRKSTTEWDESIIISEAKNFWAVTK